MRGRRMGGMHTQRVAAAKESVRPPRAQCRVRSAARSVRAEGWGGENGGVGQLEGPGEAARAAEWGGARTGRVAWREARKEIAACRVAR